MVINRKVTGKASSMGGGLAAGAGVSMAVTLAGSAGLAWLVWSGKMAGSSLGYGIMALLVLASWLGATAAAGRIRRRRVLVCAGAGGIYLMCLMGITALFFGGQYSGVLPTALMVLCGASLAILPGFRSAKGGKRRKPMGWTG